jgi:predicted DsbA family dithiol-disulfide isomerase
MVALDIFSDPVCPWCLIGKTHLDRALEARPGHPFTVAWHPFQLNPDLPPEGADRRSYLEAKFGGPRRAAEIYGHLLRAAQAAGVEINLERIARQPNTLDSHRLIHWAGIEGRQNAVVAGLFGAYFRDGRDIGDAAVLADIGAAAGLDRAVVARLLTGDADRDAILARDAHARSRGVGAVPTFVVGGRYVLSGAQPPEVWLRAIDEIAAPPRTA